MSHPEDTPSSPGVDLIFSGSVDSLFQRPDYGPLEWLFVLDVMAQRDRGLHFASPGRGAMISVKNDIDCPVFGSHARGPMIPDTWIDNPLTRGCPP